MKYLLFFFLIVFNACAFKSYNGKVIEAKTESRENGRNFIITTDGKKIYGSDIVKKGKKGKVYIFVDDKEYNFADVNIMQNYEGYYLRQGHYFLYRICKGKGEAFCLTVPDGKATTTSCYLTTNQVDLYHYTSKNLYNLVKDNPEAVAIFNSKYSKVSDGTPVDGQYQRLLAVLKSYNGIKQ